VDRLIDRHGLTAFTPETLVDRKALWGELTRTRERCYGVSVREYDLGQSGVTAPVFDDRGQVTMVLCSLAFSSELNETTAAEAGEQVREGALRLTERLGGRRPDR
jgi:DNA-binding IclR family transcriptional regulator